MSVNGQRVMVVGGQAPYDQVCHQVVGSEEAAAATAIEIVALIAIVVRRRN